MVGYIQRPTTRVDSVGKIQSSGIFLSNFQGGAFEILDLFLKQISDLLKKLWTFQYAAGFRGPGILIKRSTIVDLSVYAAWLRGPDISQNIHKIFKKYPKIDYRAFESSRHHYTADNRTARDIHNWTFLGCQNSRGGGNAPLAPLIKISLIMETSEEILLGEGGVHVSASPFLLCVRGSLSDEYDSYNDC